MRTPDVFPSGFSGAAPRLHECRECGGAFEHRRRGGNVYCPNACKSAHLGQTRKVLYLVVHNQRNELTPRAMLDFVRQGPSCFKSTNVTETWEELDALDRLLSLYGAQNAYLRRGIKQQADGVRSRLEALTIPNADEIRQYVRALEILRDVGSETRQELELRQSQAWAAVCYYRQIRDIPSLARALHGLANVCRLLGDRRTRWQMTRYAFQLLEEMRRRLSPNQLLVLHQASYWDLRSCAEGYGDSKANEKRGKLLRLAGEINTPLVWLQTWQELAGCYGRWGKVEEAEDALSQLDALRRTIDLDSMDSPTLLRAKIELYIDSKLKDEAVDVIEREYLPAYRTNPRALFLGHLRRWERDLEFVLPIDLPDIYETPMLLYVPRGEL